MTIGVQGDFLIFNFNTPTYTPTYTPTSAWTLIFYDRSNFHTQRAHYAHLRVTTQFSRRNENSSPDHTLLRPRNKTTWTSVDDPTFSSTCYKVTSLTSSGRSPTSRHHLPDLCAVPRTHQRLPADQKIQKHKKNPGEASFQWQGSMMPSICA